MRKPLNLPIEKIKTLISQGYSQADVATLIGASQSTISRIVCKGKAAQPSPALSSNVAICTCCGEMPVADGNRFLCTNCFRYADVGTSFTEHALAI